MQAFVIVVRYLNLKLYIFCDCSFEEKQIAERNGNQIEALQMFSYLLQCTVDCVEWKVQWIHKVTNMKIFVMDYY